MEITASYTVDPLDPLELVEFPSGSPSVSISSSLSMPSINITNGTTAKLQGYWVGVFPQVSIEYMNQDRTYTTVQKFSEIDEEKLFEMIDYTPDPKNHEMVTITFTAGSKTATGILVIENNYSPGRDNLKEKVALTVEKRST